MIIKVCHVSGFRPLKDGSVSLTLITSLEQNEFNRNQLLSLYQKQCMVAIKPEETPFLDAQLKELDSVDLDLEDTNKTPSKRLRAVLYRVWEQQESDFEFKEYYKQSMEKLINYFKDKLD